MPFHTVTNAPMADLPMTHQEWEEVFEAGKDALSGYFRVRGVHKDDIDDCVQDTWERVLRSPDPYDPRRASFRAYILGYAQWVLLDYYRRRERWLVSFALIEELIRRGDEGLESYSMEELLGMRSKAARMALSTEVKMLFDRMLRCAFAEVRPTHQVAAFGFNKILGETPQVIVENHSDKRLMQLGQHLEEEICTALVAPAYRTHFSPFHARMDVPCPKDHTIHVGDSTLRIYYSRDPVANVTNWSYRIKEAVFECMLKGI